MIIIVRKMLSFSNFDYPGSGLEMHWKWGQV